MLIIRILEKAAPPCVISELCLSTAEVVFTHVIFSKKCWADNARIVYEHMIAKRDFLHNSFYFYKFLKVGRAPGPIADNSAAVALQTAAVWA